MKAVRFASAVAAVAMTAGSALAGPQVDFAGKKWGSPGNGGPFQFNPVAGSGFGYVQGLGAHGATAAGFITFCLELNENLPSTRYDVTIDTSSVLGGVGGGSADPLDPKTAFLYQTFMDGGLTGVGGFSYGDASSGYALQQAFWRLEDEIAVFSGTAGEIAMATALKALADGSGWTTLGNVRVMNLWDTVSGAPRQSQLIIIPLPGAASMATAGLATMIGFGVLRRRR